MMMGGIGILVMFLWISVLGFIIYGVYNLFINRVEKKEDQALLILKEKFVKGDLTEEEYIKRKNVLKTN